MSRQPSPALVPEQLRIWQQNVNTSPIAQHDLLIGATPDDWDVIAIQEPPLSNLNLAIGITSKWYSVYPTDHLCDKQPKTRSLLLVNKKISTNAWKNIPIKSPDVTAIELATSRGRLQIINVYNDGAHGKTLDLLDDHLDALPRHVNVILLGDFNRHHPYWDEPRNQHLFTDARLLAAEQLLDLVAMNDLKMTLPEGIPTHELSTTKNYSRLDNVFMTANLADFVTLCTALPSPRLPCTDHFSIHTIIDLSVQKAETTQRRNFQKTNWESFIPALRARTESIQTGPLRSIVSFDKRLKELMSAIQITIEEQVPVAKDSPYSKRWWKKELKKLRKKRNKLSNRAERKREEPDDPVHACYAEAHAHYKTEQKKGKDGVLEQLH